MKLTQKQKDTIMKEIQEKGFSGEQALNYAWVRANQLEKVEK